MQLLIDTQRRTLDVTHHGIARSLPLYSKEAFEVLSQQWVNVGWDQKYPYTFSWFGRPIIQLPEDIIRIQEVIYRLKPDVIVETGVAHGGSLVFYASLCKALGKGRVVGVDIEIRKHNRQAIEAHELASLIDLVEGDSVAPEILSRVREKIKPNQTVLVILDSCHSHSHVLAELEQYSPLVTPGSYIVATDGVMEYVYDCPRGQPAWKTDNPCSAVKDFVEAHPEFVIEIPKWPFNESLLTANVTHWPLAWLRRTEEA
jgi:cephalosporin hydroxylase